MLGAALLTRGAPGSRSATSATAQLEYDFSRLRRRDTWTAGEGYWGGKMDHAARPLPDRPPCCWPTASAEARAIAAKLREAMKKPPLDTMVASVRTIDDLLPPDRRTKREQVDAHPAQDDAARCARACRTTTTAGSTI